jgi:mono/diheme cytochrome c family protein
VFRRENHVPLISAAAVLTLAILVTFQLYQWREPARLQADAAADLEASVTAGKELYTVNCASCHGPNGEGLDGPALNSKALLSSVTDDQLFGLIRTGVPGTGMPAWSQSFGGLLTDEDVRQVVAYLRSWEPDAPEVGLWTSEPDPVRGAAIFQSVCSVCHGSQGAGTERAPALNDPELLNTFDDEWFRETIAMGRPSKGMPTWGTVLSPSEIDDLVALLAQWRQGGLPAEIEARPPVAGPELFSVQCAACHGAQGEGGVGPPLMQNEYVDTSTDAELEATILGGRPGTAMPPFEGRLTAQEVSALVTLLRGWQR